MRCGRGLGARPCPPNSKLSPRFTCPATPWCSTISGTSAARSRWSRAGAKALATGSHPVADANGWPDGQQVPIDFALANAKRIVDAVELPLTVDFEGAYSADPEEGGANVARLAATGAVGCNFEDQVIGGEGLHPLDLQVQRIAAIRRAVGDAILHQRAHRPVPEDADL